ncbi:MAG: BamA/TamA family outer membrane protein [Spirosomaceae bacterium]|nr:BamA/TamA family outer membrane protein [Spirosomataceae bacterium]
MIIDLHKLFNKYATKTCLLFAMGVIISSCNVYEKLPDNQKLYAGAEVKMVADSTLSKATVEIIQSQLETLPRPSTNTYIFGYPLQVGLYYAFQTDKQKGLKYKIQQKWGQKPIFLTPNIINQNNDILDDFLEKEGFFKPSVSGTIQPTKKIKEAKAVYNVILPKRYALDSVAYESDSLTTLPEHLITDFKKTQGKSILKPNQPYRFDNIQTEQLRIDRQLREEGYYYFRSDLVNIEADTTIGKQRANIYYSLDENMPVRSQKQYLINDIYVFSSRNIEEMQADSVDFDADYFRGVILADSSKEFKQEIFTSAIAFRPGNAYSTEKNDVTMQRLINLDNFQLVKNRFEVVNRLDSSLLNVYYYLSPKQKKSVRAELNALTRSSGFAGSQVSLSWLNRNAFRGAEKLTISANAGFDVQLGGGSKDTESELQVRNNYRLALNGELTFPRFIMPFFKLDPESSRILPKTTISAGYESIIQRNFYNLNSINGSFNYVWRQGGAHEHVFSPVAATFVQASNISEDFLFAVFEDPIRLLPILNNQFILGGTYSYTYTPIIPPSKKYSYAFYGNLDFAGNLLGVLDKLRPEDKRGFLFNNAYSQYIRADGDFRYYYNLSKNLKLANRVFAGFGIPYGNSLSLPFTRQYFSGGSNSIRAFRARGVGPGTYIRDPNDGFQSFFGSFTGDVKLEFNTELRQKINEYVGMALFVDAGNIWNYKDVSTYGEENGDVLFGKDFYKQLAVGAGVGLRLDVSFFVLRADLATPVINPGRIKGERFVLDEINLRDPSWRQNNLILNIAVGYPF